MRFGSCGINLTTTDLRAIRNFKMIVDTLVAGCPDFEKEAMKRLMSDDERFSCKKLWMTTDAIESMQTAFANLYACMPEMVRHGIDDARVQDVMSNVDTFIHKEGAK